MLPSYHPSLARASRWHATCSSWYHTPRYLSINSPYLDFIPCYLVITPSKVLLAYAMVPVCALRNGFRSLQLLSLHGCPIEARTYCATRLPWTH